jgi:hypothetical protein
MAKYIEKEIPFADKTDTKGLTVFRFGSSTLRAPAPEICDTIEIRFVECMNRGVHDESGSKFTFF